MATFPARKATTKLLDMLLVKQLELMNRLGIKNQNNDNGNDEGNELVCCSLPCFKLMIYWCVEIDSDDKSGQEMEENGIDNEAEEDMADSGNDDIKEVSDGQSDLSDEGGRSRHKRLGKRSIDAIDNELRRRRKLTKKIRLC